MQARFKHDCPVCQFLGCFKNADLYVCKAKASPSKDPTVIARYSSDPPDYSSGICFSFGSSEMLTEARLRAQATGIIDFPLEAALYYDKPLTVSEK